MQDLFGMGRLGTGFSVIAGPMEIQVGALRAREAAELLREADLEAAAAGGLDEADDEPDGEPPSEASNTGD
jgi:hypothetical protein